MNKNNIIISIFSIMIFTSLLHAKEAEITLIHMGDIHGHLMPRDNARLGDVDYGEKVGGLAYLYSKIVDIRKNNPRNLLINTGDTIQGSAEALFSRGQALVEILNQFHIDAYVPGNWDFVYGTERFLELFSQESTFNKKANWHPIAANLYFSTLYEFPATPYAERAGQRVLPPFKIYQVGDLKVGILGLTAERGPKALSPMIMDGFYLTTGQDELKDAIPALREVESVDLLVLISERGLANNLEIADRYPGIDVILSSDMHEETHQMVRTESGTLLVEEGQDGTLLGELKLTIKDKKIQNYQWTAHRISSQNIAPNIKIQTYIDRIRKKYIKGKNFTAHVNPINGAILRTPIDTIVGHTRTPLHRANFNSSEILTKKFKNPAVIEGTSHQFISDAFRLACHSDVGMIRGFRYGTHILPGPIKLEDLYHFMPVGAQVACGLMSGEQLRLHIERSAQSALSQWVGVWGGGWLTGFSGITFDLDPYNEFGMRVQNLKINGERADLEKMYSVAGYWYMDEPGKINLLPALNIRRLKSFQSNIVDSTDIAAYYLQTLPDHTIELNEQRVRLLRPLPTPIAKNLELQPLRGAYHAEYE